MTITLRLTKGEELSHAELDGNFTDLDNRLSPLESAPPSHAHSADDITSGTLANARVAESNVTQHEAALSITESQISDLAHNAASLLGVPLDATVGSPSDGDILVFRDLGGDWVLEAKPAGASPNVNDLGDVTITSVVDNEVLAFDNDTGEWINQTLDEIGLTAGGTIQSLSSADYTILASDPAYISFFGPPDNNRRVFRPATNPTFVGALRVLQNFSPAFSINFNDGTSGSLGTDYVIPPKSFLIISWNNDIWVVSEAYKAFPNVSDLGNVVISSVGNNEVLAFDTASGKWINQTASEAGLATSSQGALASTALQPADIATGTITPRGDDVDLSGGVDGEVLTVQADGSAAFETASAHTHTVSQITDAGALADNDTVGTVDIDDDAVNDAKLSHTTVTPGDYTNGNFTVNQQGRLTAASSGSGGGGLSTVDDSDTAITFGNALANTHRRLIAGTAITITLDAQASEGTKIAATPKGAGAVTVEVESGATYSLPMDTAGRTTSFGLTGYGYFEVTDNSDGNSAEWDFIGESDHDDTADNDIDFADQVVSRPELKDYSETSASPSSSSGVLELDMETANAFQVTLTENITTLTLSNPPATGKIGTIFLILTQDGTGGRTITWPASVNWADGTAPTLSAGAGGVDILTLVTPDAGTTWYGFVGGLAFSVPA